MVRVGKVSVYLLSVVTLVSACSGDKFSGAKKNSAAVKLENGDAEISDESPSPGIKIKSSKSPTAKPTESADSDDGLLVPKQVISQPGPIAPTPEITSHPVQEGTPPPEATATAVISPTPVVTATPTPPPEPFELVTDNCTGLLTTPRGVDFKCSSGMAATGVGDEEMDHQGGILNTYGAMDRMKCCELRKTIGQPAKAVWKENTMESLSVTQWGIRYPCPAGKLMVGVTMDAEAHPSKFWCSAFTFEGKDVVVGEKATDKSIDSGSPSNCPVNRFIQVIGDLQPNLSFMDFMVCANAVVKP